MPRQIWNYYKELAERIGTDKDGVRQGFSVSWFYTAEERNPQTGETTMVDTFNRLNNLSLAFLGDEEAREGVYLADEDEVEAMEQRVRAICGGSPNPSQINAVSNALLNDITIIQGPPGTGKTATIRNFLACVRQIYPDAKIAVISANREAINNAVDEVRTDPALRNVFARLGNQSVRKEFKESLLSVNPDLYHRLSGCTKENKWFYPEWFLNDYPIIFSTIHSVRKCVNVSEYDYVLVDECSQVPSVIGMLAINTAKHLVLLGDDEQLPPIHKEEESNEIEAVPLIRQRAPYYLDEKDNSFMKACKESFADKCRSILLNEHYRCHPAIINFCNQYVYDNQLITKTADDGKMPIRIRWYEGDYWEKIISENDKQNDDTEPENCKLLNVNKMQIEIFIEDEYPEILELLQNNNDYGICVLSPYRYQLELLQNRLKELAAQADGRIDNELADVDPDVNDIAQLTIHKAQGRGFDRVYIMPVEDTGKNPWSQKKELINVAVSRAKKELCVITSASWMPKELQEELTGHYVYTAPLSAECYIRNLLTYVGEERKNREVSEGYGFVKTSIQSVFDKVPFYRQKYRYSDERVKPDGYAASAPEQCLYYAIQGNEVFRNGGFRVLREVPLSAFPAITTYDRELRSYMEDGARFDFVIAKEDRAYAIVEVDGEYHRCDQETMHNDELKDRAVRSLGRDFAENRFIRIATDGTSKEEMSDIEAVLSEEAENLPKFKEKGLRLLEEKLDNNIRFLRENLTEEDFRNNIQRVNFANGNIPDYSNLYQSAYYMLKYARFYALEYYWMYDLALQVLAEKKGGRDLPVVYSFGCGSMVDGLSLIYAHNRLRQKNSYLFDDKEKVYYSGIDLVRWPEETALLDLEQEKVALKEFMGEGHNGMVGFWDEHSTFMGNILCFPKILSERLDEGNQGETVIDQFCEGLSDAFLTSDYIVLCISFRGKNTYENGAGSDRSNSERIVNALTEKGYRIEDYDAFSDRYSWVCRDYFEELSPELKVFASRDDAVVDYDDLYSDFAISEDEKRYMSDGEIIRDNCPYFNQDEDVVSGYCKGGCKTRHPECRLGTYPRKNINSGGDRTCFQILLFHKE